MEAAILHKNIALITRGVTANEPRLCFRALRNLPAIRRQLTATILASILTAVYPVQDHVASFLHHVMDPQTIHAKKQGDIHAGVWSKERTGILPEVDMYMALLVTIHLIDTKQVAQAINMGRIEASCPARS